MPKAILGTCNILHHNSLSHIHKERQIIPSICYRENRLAYVNSIVKGPRQQMIVLICSTSLHSAASADEGQEFKRHVLPQSKFKG